MVSDKPVCKPCYVKNHAVVRSILGILLYHLTLCLYLSLLEVRNRKYYFQIRNVISASGVKVQIMQKQYMCSLLATSRFLAVHPKCYLIIKSPFLKKFLNENEINDSDRADRILFKLRFLGAVHIL